MFLFPTVTKSYMYGENSQRTFIHRTFMPQTILTHLLQRTVISLYSNVFIHWQQAELLKIVICIIKCYTTFIIQSINFIYMQKRKPIKRKSEVLYEDNWAWSTENYSLFCVWKINDWKSLVHSPNYVLQDIHCWFLFITLLSCFIFRHKITKA